MTQQYKIIFKGKLLPNYDKNDVKAKIIVLFKISDQKADQLFDGKEYALKSDVSLDEANRYKSQLEKIGIITEVVNTSQNKKEHPQPNYGTVSTAMTKSTNKKNSKGIIITAVLLLLGAGGAGAYLFLQKELIATTPIASVTGNGSNTKSQSTTLTDSTTKETTSDQTTMTNVPDCNNENVIQNISKMLTEGLPKLLTNTPDEVKFTLKAIDHNQELYFDEGRKKRLCGLLAQYEIDSAALKDKETTDKAPPFINYEVIYEVLFTEPDQLNFRTFKHTAVATNINQNSPQK